MGIFMPAINRVKGFTLVELVVGIVVLAIAIGIVTVLVVPSASRSVDPIIQVRAAELAQSLLNEITSRSFDENSDRVNGQIRCNEDLVDDSKEVECTGDINEGTGVLGADLGETRADYDDIDDYDGLVESGPNIRNSLGQALGLTGDSNVYEGFTASVLVFYDSDYDGIPNPWSLAQNTKHIRITIAAPNGQEYVFSTYRSNF